MPQVALWFLAFVLSFCVFTVHSQTSSGVPIYAPLAVRSPYLNAWIKGPALVHAWPSFWNSKVSRLHHIVVHVLSEQCSEFGPRWLRQSGRDSLPVARQRLSKSPIRYLQQRANHSYAFHFYVASRPNSFECDFLVSYRSEWLRILTLL